MNTLRQDYELTDDDGHYDIRHTVGSMARQGNVREVVKDGRPYRVAEDEWVLMDREAALMTLKLAEVAKRNPDMPVAETTHIMMSSEALLLAEQLGWHGASGNKTIRPFRISNGRVYEIDTAAEITRLADIVNTLPTQVRIDVSTVAPVVILPNMLHIYRPADSVAWEDTWARAHKCGHWLGTAMATAFTKVLRLASNTRTQDYLDAATLMEILKRQALDDNTEQHFGVKNERAALYGAEWTAELEAQIKKYQVAVATPGTEACKNIHRYMNLAKAYLRSSCSLEESKTGRNSVISRNAVVDVDRSASGSALNSNDWMLARVQAVWHDWEVTGWIAALQWASNLMVAVSMGMLDHDDAAYLTQYAFTTNTWRKFVSIDVVLDAMRDVDSGEVTKAAMRTVRLGRSIDPLYLVTDDFEFMVRRGGIQAHEPEAQLLEKLISTMLVPAEHVPISPAKWGAVQPEEMLVTAKIRDCEQGQFSFVEASVAESNCVLATWEDDRQGRRAETKVTLAGEEYDMYTINSAYGSRSYLRYDLCTATLKDKRAAHAAGALYREQLFSATHPLVEFLDLFPGVDINVQEDRITKIVALATPSVTQRHHQHAGFTAVLTACAGRWPAVLDNTLVWEDSTYTFVTTLLLAMNALPPHLRHLMESWSGWGVASAQEFHTAAKALSTACKSLDNKVAIGSTLLDLAPLFEWETTLNRGFGSMSWADEVRDRRDPSQNVDLTVEEVRPHIQRVMKDLMATVYKYSPKGDALNRTWDDFYASRARETPAGSSSSRDETCNAMKADIKANTKQDVTKTQVMAQLPDDLPMSHFINKIPQVISTVSIKYEWGKQRALFAAVLEHYILAAFAFHGIENFMPQDCPVGKAADASVVCKRVMAMAKHGVYVCVDAKNFNILHQLTMTAEIVKQYRLTFHDMLSPEQRQALLWLEQAELDQRIVLTRAQMGDLDVATGMAEGWIEQEAEDKFLVRVTGGLFSGHRLTMFFNTILNRVYYHIAAERVGLKPNALHSGDDVFAKYSNIGQALLMKEGFKSFNYTLQLSKCFVNSVAEFLRISHKNRNTSQYYSRSCATAIHGRIETGHANDMQALVGANIRRASEIVTRYGSRSICKRLQLMQNVAACARWRVPTITYTAYLQLPVVRGGIRAEESKETVSRLMVLERTAAVDAPAVQYFAKSPGVKHAARELVQALQLDGHYGRAASALAAGVATSSALSEYAFSLRWMTEEVITLLYRVAGTQSHVAQSREYVLSKAAGLFNVLVEEGRFGPLRGIAAGVHSSWAPILIESALLPAEATKRAYKDDSLTMAAVKRLIRGVAGVDANW